MSPGLICNEHASMKRTLEKPIFNVPFIKEVNGKVNFCFQENIVSSQGTFFLKCVCVQKKASEVN